MLTTFIYILMVAAIVILLIGQLFKLKKVTDKISLAVVLVMFILRMLLIK